MLQRFLLQHILSPFLLLMLLATATGCVTATPYQPRRNTYGYSEVQIDHRTVRVAFRGNAYTPREIVETYLLYRAAEVTLEHSFDYFLIVDGGIAARQRVEDYSGPIFGGFGFYSYGGHSHGVGTGLGLGIPESYYTYKGYDSSVVIKMYKGWAPQDDARAYGAKEVLEYLGPRVQRPIK